MRNWGWEKKMFSPRSCTRSVAEKKVFITKCSNYVYPLKPVQRKAGSSQKGALERMIIAINNIHILNCYK